MKDYVHGYKAKETARLYDQANSLDSLLHVDSIWEDGSLILEAGCGVGAQTRLITPRNTKSQFVSIDTSQESLEKAEALIDSLNINNVKFEQEDIYELHFDDNHFDHVFVCFVLEHLSNPIDALSELKRVLKPGGTIMAIEGDHGSTYFHPDSTDAQKSIECLIELQKQKGGDANIGRKLYPLLNAGGYDNVCVSPRMVYVDDSHPNLVEGFTINTFIAMIEGIEIEAVSQNITTQHTIRKGIEDLYKTTKGEGTFCYTFFKGIGTKIT